ncbi:hypothetical protein N7474_003840 [Penicillium riverlandense]|uniref:uncharacterized protein n=1 Tax=Penicillium riverlandense TaxID=1903569 RepID=UPI002548C497|nr:uncharacterized protein N7474_003840 [Penicillium riverlandense]KAJ5818249.1 hypothetical protein N7474_003840 [Penicillium riverlandense]
MGSCLRKIAYNAAYGPAERDLANYLRTVTPAVVLDDLRDYLVQYGAGGNALQAIFDACSVQDSPNEQPHWTKESLRDHIAKAHPDTTIPDTAIDVLWSCFYFYAFHPFPRHGADNGKIERPAFERAIILLAFKGTEFLGTTRGHHYRASTYGRLYICRSNVDRIFRSIGRVSHRPNQSSLGSPFIDEDVMDVLASAQPNPVKGNLGANTLKLPAQRLLKGANPQYQVHIKDLTTLTGLLNRMRLYKLTWGQQCFHYGSLENSSPQKMELVDILVQPFRPDREGFLTLDSMTRGLDILPNLEQRFHQLWAIIFQPPIPEASLAFGTESLPDSTMSDILRSVSLFVPPYEAHGKRELAQRFRPFSFRTIYQSSAQELDDSVALTHIIQSIAERDSDHRPHLLLFLGDQAQSQLPEVMGAFFPGTSRRQSTEEEDISKKTGEFKLGPPQLLFQLQPSFRVHRWNGADRISRPLAYGSMTGNLKDLAAHYWIGDLDGSKVGLEIDPVTRQAKLVQNKAAAADWSGGGYEDAIRNNENSEASSEKSNEGTEAGFTVTHICVYRIEGGDDMSAGGFDIDDQWEVYEGLLPRRA